MNTSLTNFVHELVNTANVLDSLHQEDSGYIWLLFQRSRSSLPLKELILHESLTFQAVSWHRHYTSTRKGNNIYYMFLNSVSN